VNFKKPIVIRYPRGGEDRNMKFQKHSKIESGKSELLQEGKDITIIAIGKMVVKAMKIANKLKQIGIEAEVINARFLKPLDENTIKKSIEKTKNVITIEDGTIIGGLGTAVKELIVDNNLQEIKINSYAYPDEFIEHGSVEELEKKFGLDEEIIQNSIEKLTKNSLQI
jgi:1-deoxy-D-xylulose-5-phosphate synthase